MDNWKLYVLVPMAFVLFAMPVSMALGPVREGLLTGAYDLVECHTDFEVGVINSIDTAVPQANLSSYADTLTSDTEQLKTYTDANDSESFKSFLRGTYEPDVRTANQAIKDVRKNFHSWNVSIGTIKNLKDSYSSLKTSFDSCKVDSLKQAGNGKVTAYQTILSTHTERANKLSEKGIDASGMLSVISGAQATIVIPLQNAISSATTGKEIGDAVRGFCLANGCKDGLNYHFYAKFELAKLTAILNYIKANATAAGLGTQVTSVQTDLANAQSALDAVGTAKYDPTNEKAVWDNLKDAAKTTKEIMRLLRTNNTS